MRKNAVVGRIVSLTEPERRTLDDLPTGLSHQHPRSERIPSRRGSVDRLSVRRVWSAAVPVWVVAGSALLVTGLALHQSFALGTSW